MSKLVVLAAFTIACQSTPQIVFRHGEVRGRLKHNGLRFVVMPDATTRLVEVDVRYEVGAREDPPGKAGLAHLVEHLMFQQRPDGPTSKPLMSVLQQMTLHMNAYTNWDTTHYMATAQGGLADALVKIEAIRMHDGCSTISEDEFLREREVVRNEIRGDNRAPVDRIPQLALQAIYPAGHAYAQMIGGDDAQLATITLRDACDFMQKYYVPERAIVIVAGGVDPDATLKSISTWFAHVDRRAAAPRRIVEPFAVAKGRQTIELDLERPWVAVGWPLPDARTAEGKAAQLGIPRAFGEVVSRTEEYECATQAAPVILGGKEAPVFVIALELKSMGKLDECLDFVWKAARNAHRGWDAGLSSQVDEVKHRQQAAFIQSLEPLVARTNRIGDFVQFARDVDFDSNELYAFRELDRIARLDIGAVGGVIKRALDPDRARVIVFKPSRQGVGDGRSNVTFHAAPQETIDDAVDPAEAGRPLRVKADLEMLSSAIRFQLGNGMRVVLLPTHAMPVVAAQLIFDAGEATAPESAALGWGAAEFLQQAPGTTATRDAGVSIGCDALPDHTICTARGMSPYLNIIIKGLERLVKVGVYDQQQIERWQTAKRQQMKLKRTQERVEFERQQRAAIFGPDHPYARTGVITPQSIGKLGRDELWSFKDRHYTAANATLVVAGAFDPKQAESLIRDNFDWANGHHDAAPAPAPFARNGPQYIGVVGSTDPQVDVAILYPSPAGVSGQQAARLVLAEMMNERIFRIRTRLGATYGTYARREARLAASFYDIGGAVDAPRTGEAIKAMRDELQALRDGTDFDATFVRARRKVVQRLLGESTVTAELASRLGQLARFGLPPDYFDTLVRQAAFVSPVQVKDLIARELAPAGEVIVLRGDRASVTKGFADAGITDVKLVEPEYR